MEGGSEHIMTYAISISFQLSGSLILLLWSFSKVSTNVLDMCFPGVIFAKRNKAGNLYIEKEMVQQKVKTILLNVWAFFYISVGYLLNVFSENDADQLWLNFVLIVILTPICLLLARFASKYVSAAWGKEDRILTDDEIEKYSIPTEATEQEILDLLND